MGQISQEEKNGKRVIFSENAYLKIVQVLDALMRRLNAELCVFADMQGYSICQSGDEEKYDISTLTAVAAGAFSATAEMSNIISGEKRFRYMYHEGITKNIYQCSVDNNYLLIVVFRQDIALGMVRALAHQAVQRMEKLVDELLEEGEKAAQFMDGEFRSLLGKELDKSFGH